MICKRKAFSSSNVFHSNKVSSDMICSDQMFVVIVFFKCIVHFIFDV